MVYLTSASTTNFRKLDFDSSSYPEVSVIIDNNSNNNWEVLFCYGPESFLF